MTGIMHVVSITRPTTEAARQALLVVGAAVIVAVVGTRLTAASVDRPAPAAVPVPSPSWAAGPANGSGYWVPGDLVGEANPAAVAAALCAP